MKRFTINTSTALALGLGAVATLALLALLWLLTGSPQVTRAADLTVCPTGSPTCDFSTIQAGWTPPTTAT